MKIVKLQKSSTAYIFTPRALIGPNLSLGENLLLTVTGGKIEAIAPLNPWAIPAEVKNDPRFYRLEEGLTLLPSLIDAHVHLALDPKAYPKAQTAAAQETDLMDRIQRDLNTMLKKGIGAVRDGGDRLGINRKVGRMIREGSLCGPRVVSTGEALRKPGSYGTFLGSGVKDLRRRLSALAGSENRQLKVVVSGIVSFRKYGRVEPASSFSLAELREVVMTAHMHGMKVMAHASSGEAVELAVQAGVDSIEHGYFISKRQLKDMASRGTAWVPTVIPVAVQAREPFNQQWRAAEIDIITRTYREHMEKLDYAAGIGVPLGLGTDSGASGVRHGINLVEEMLLYAAAGLSPRAVLYAATIINANILGLDKTFGSLDVNKEPHFIAVQGNPLTDLSAVKEAVWMFSQP